MKRSFEKIVIKDMGEKSKEQFGFQFDKIHRHGKVNGTKQNVIGRFRSRRYPSDIYYARNATERIEDDSSQGIQFVYADFNGNI